MNDAEFEAQKARLEPLLEWWKHVLGLDQWLIVHVFLRGSISGSAGRGDFTPAVAQTEADFRYMHAKMVWNLEALADEEDDDLIGYVAHEFTHCLTNMFSRYAGGGLGSGIFMDAALDELQTTQISKALVRAYKAGEATPGAAA